MIAVDVSLCCVQGFSANKNGGGMHPKN